MLHSLQSLLIYVAPFLAVLGLVVTVHEFGHFLAAKACGVAVDRFSIGFGRALLSWRDRSGVEWRLAWLPLGGYVRFAGDENAASVPDADDLQALRREILAREGQAALDRYFHFKPIWQRAIVVAAGPIANFVLSVILLTVLLMAVGERSLPAKVDQLAPGQPAALAGFRSGDVIERADGQPIDSFEALQQYVQIRAGSPIRFTVERGAKVLTLTATPVTHEIDNGLGSKQKVGVLGIIASHQPGDLRFRRYGPLAAVRQGAARTWDMLSSTLVIIERLVTGQLPAEQLSGPLGIAQLSGAVVHAGAAGEPNLGMKVVGAVTNLLSLAAVLSVSVGFMNLLPVPVLDGGHLLFYAYEAVARRPVGARVQAAGYRVGLALLLGLMLFATWNDLHRLRVFQFLGGLFS
ncbi:MAG TPA: RIP metalloprotease RseP [Caulobacteraceae bacterium]|nr:RIP metalloprotease RseP [Caulobacteraceae bacterium]